ncbi:histidine kinase [Paracoccus luteus]|uniref:histidine kinase n=1 Tax=Paracoccus luteus TaxID=2508543 RepID=UPI00106F1F66|nr:histidine kinase [Paracoccus luteus]
MTLTARILSLVLVVQLVLAGAVGAILARNARGAVAAEVDGSIQATRALVLASVATLIDSAPGPTLVPALAERLVQPRHAWITLYDMQTGRTLAPVSRIPRRDPAPAWFARRLAPVAHASELPIVESGNIRGLAVIAADPTAEIAEIWDDARALALVMALAAVAQVALTAAVLGGGLRPLGRLRAVLGRLARGDLAARAGRVAVPDLAPLAADIDRLAAALAVAQADRARLSRQMVGRGDQERKAIARDLHDEYGPNLFALRVEASAIRDAAAEPALRGHAENILAIADDIRRVNTALLSGLRPMAVGQLPLAAVLSDMFDDLAARHDQIDWTLDLPPALPEPDEATALTIYRILQEGTTNVLRHAGASAVTARVDHGPDGWTVRLADDGRGLGAAAEGNGLSGMRERVALLGGTFAVQSGPAGATLTATLPADAP